MAAIPPKKMLILNIVEILKRYSDADHPLSQQDIVEKLEKEYDMTVDRKAVRRNLLDLMAWGYPVECRETQRVNRHGRKETVCTNWYWDREFTDAELRLLIDSLLFSKHIPYNQCRQLIAKLEKLSNVYFKAKVKHICYLPEERPENKQLFYTIDVLDEAIRTGRQVQFVYNRYDIDKKLHPNLNEDGQPKQYLINPYQIVSTNGRYYLICNYDKYDNLSNYRIDRITDIQLLDTPAKPREQVVDFQRGWSLPKHMAEHIYMFAGESVRVVFRAQRSIINEIIDWFGMDVHFSDVTDEQVTVSVMVNQQAMRYWALQYARYITVLAPERLVETLKEDIRMIGEKYQI